MSETERKSDATVDAVTWFAVLENARQRGDFDRAATAKRKLEALGIKIVYRPNLPGRKVVAYA